MDPATRKWLKGCGIGCGVLLFLVILGLLAGSFLMLHPFRGAVETGQELDERFGQQSEFTPACDGAPAPDRMKAFINVRRALMEVCSEIEQTAQTMERLDELEADAPKKEILREFARVTRAVIDMGVDTGKFFAVRNNALLDNGMSRGEYTYIFTMAYLPRLQPDRRARGEQQTGAYNFNERARRVLRQILRNQLEQYGVRGDCRVLTVEEETENRRALEEELRELENDHGRLPWQDGLPAAISESLAPFRDELDSVYCEHTLEFEFVQNRKTWFGIQGD